MPESVRNGEVSQVFIGEGKKYDVSGMTREELEKEKAAKFQLAEAIYKLQEQQKIIDQQNSQLGKYKQEEDERNSVGTRFLEFSKIFGAAMAGMIISKAVFESNKTKASNGEVEGLIEDVFDLF